MLIAPLSLIVAGGLALQATASPIRVVVVTSSQEISSAPFGHPGDNGPVAHFIRPNVEMMAATTTMIQNGPGAGRHRGPCSSMKAKGLMMANKFRHIFGLPPIEPYHPRPDFHKDIKAHTDIHSSNVPVEQSGEVRILPIMPTVPFIGTPVPASGEDKMHRRPHFHHHFHHQDTFLKRVHHALMSLGPWEGRAVAFVIGCGLGVLLRMIWVMTVLSLRVLRGTRNTEEQEDYYYEVPQSVEYIVFDRDAEEILVPPPQYTDEKVALATETPAKAPEAEENSNAN